MDLGSGDHADSLTLCAGVPVSTPEPTTWSLIADSITLSSVDQGSNVGNGDIDTLDQFAQLTGGKVYANDIQKAVTEVLAGMRLGLMAGTTRSA